MTRRIGRAFMVSLGFGLFVLDGWVEYVLSFLKIFFLVSFFCLAFAFFEDAPRFLQWISHPGDFVSHDTGRHFFVLILSVSGALFGIQKVIQRRAGGKPA